MSSSSGTSTPKAHNRHLSADDRRRVLRPRSSTKGPLDDPLSASLPALSISPSPGPTPRAVSPSPSNPPPMDPELVLASIDKPLRDFSFLLRPEIYHTLGQLDIPQAYRDSPHQPSPETPLSVLLAHGHFRAAAIRAASALTTEVSPTSHAEIFSLLYTRLACLTLINNTVIAAQEVKALEDLNSTFYRDPITQAHLVPWELRVLAVRLQGIGYGDPRRGVMGYYELARDARDSIAKARSKSPPDEGEIRLWQDRLWDLGIRVGNALVEMGDLETASRHLNSLQPAAQGPAAHAMNARLALIYLRGGNITAAQQCLARSGGEEPATDKEELSKGIIDALCSMADGNYDLAVSQWRALLPSGPGSSGSPEEKSTVETEASNDTTSQTASETKQESLDPGRYALIVQNLAVCLLYAGRLSESRALLTSLIPPSSTTLEPQIPSDSATSISEPTPATATPVQSILMQASTFNLCTIYELCTERSRTLKLDLAARLAANPPPSATLAQSIVNPENQPGQEQDSQQYYSAKSSLPLESLQPLRGSQPLQPLQVSQISQGDTQNVSQWTAQPLKFLQPIAVRWEKDNADFKL